MTQPTVSKHKCLPYIHVQACNDGRLTNRS